MNPLVHTVYMLTQQNASAWSEWAKKVKTLLRVI